MPSSRAPNQAPPQRPAQFASTDVGSLRQSINLFRGSVSYQRPLVQLPGKLGDDTLAVELGLSYDSSIHLAATRWNLDAPTGVVGLGWMLPRERIVAESDGALSLAARRFILETGGARNRLVPTPRPWVRALLDAALSSRLGGPLVSQELITAFAAAGLPLSPQATVSGQGPWDVEDPVHEQSFVLSEQAGAAGAQVLAVAAGGLGFEPQDFSFWRVRYYPAYERWVAVDDSGTQRVFGGGVSVTSQGFATSTGHGIEWGVRFGGERGGWVGSSTRREGQAQYAHAWNLVARVDRYGDRVTYAYNTFERGADGLLPTVEQRVGTDGLPYTKACYLSRITGVGGRSVALDYAPKWYTATVHEYQDPHKVLAPAADGVPPENLTTPNAFQDRYETLYLDRLRVLDGADRELYRVTLDYARPQAVPGTLAASSADLCKRFLTGITEQDPAGRSLPGYVFAYALEEGADHPGALTRVIYPEGATGTFAYDGAVPLDICERDLTVTPPAGFGATGNTPFVWLGPDYAVTCWLDAQRKRLSLQVHTWTGRWQRSTPSEGLVYEGEQALDASTLAGATSTDFFGLTFRVGDEVRVLPFRRSTLRTWEWAPYSNEDGTSWLSFPRATGARLAAGERFLLATVSGFDGTGDNLYRLTWDWQRRAWNGGDAPAVRGRMMQVLARGERYLLWQHLNGKGTVSLAWLDGDHRWNDGGTLDVELGPRQTEMFWADGPSMVAWCEATDSSATGRYALRVRRWDADYQFQAGQGVDAENLRLSSVTQVPRPSWPPVPSVSGNELVGTDRYLWRFDGVGWNTSEALTDQGRGRPGWMAYAYGRDVVLQVLNVSDGVTTRLLAYDADSGTFARAPRTLPALPPGEDFGYPAATGEDFIVASNTVWYRGAAPGWKGPESEQPVYEGAPEGTDFFSVVDAAPDFAGWRLPPGQGAARIALALLENGRAKATSTIAGQTFVSPLSPEGLVSPPRAGKSPAGPATLVTYPQTAPDFERAPSLTLHRFVGGDIQGALVDYPVRSLTIDTGLGEPLRSVWSFDRVSAACDPSGEIIKYYRSTAWDGCDEPSAARGGRTVTTYDNGATDEGLSMLDGQPLQTLTFEGAALFAAPTSAALGLTPDVPPGTPVPQALRALFPAEAALSAQAVYEARRVDGRYLYWSVEDPTTQRRYTVDSDEDPKSPTAVRGYTGRLVASETNTWEVFTSRAGFTSLQDAVQGTWSEVMLHGAYVRPASIRSMQDGLALETRYGYLGGLPAPLTGGTTSESFDTRDVHGVTWTTEMATTFAAAVPAWRALAWENVLTPVAQMRTRVWPKDGVDSVSACAATTYGPFETAGGCTVLDVSARYDWGGPTASNGARFPFGADAVPPEWFMRTRILTRDGRGIATLSKDASGVAHSTRVDATGQLPLLMVTNADLAAQEADACGFESQEPLTAWTFTGGAAVTAERAHTGVRCAWLPGGDAAVERAPLTPANNARTYVAGCWYARPRNAAAGASPVLIITVTSGSTVVGSPLRIALDDTSGRWAWVQAAIALGEHHARLASDGPLSVRLRVEADGGELWVDDVGFYPRDANVMAQAFEPGTHKLTANVGPGGLTSRAVYGPTRRMVGQVRANGALKGVQLEFSSRQRNAAFNPGDPNAQVVVQATRGGTLQTFRDGEAWRDAWTPSAEGAWRADSGLLLHEAATDASLTATAPEAEAWALYVEPTAVDGGPVTLSPGFGFTVGTAARLSWDGHGWRLDVGGQGVSPVGPGASSPASLLLVVTGGRLLFWTDGGLVFSVAAGVRGGAALTSGTGALGLRNLAWMEGPVIQARLQDSTGADRQLQALGGDTYLVNQLIEDALGRTIVKTKSVPGDFGSGAALAPLLYRTGLVDLPAFQASLAGSGVMAGDATDYWNGEAGRSADGGYPYSRRLLEASPLGRTVEVGLPGAAWAIVDPYTTPADSRPTSKVRYAADAAVLPGLDLPATDFRVTTFTSPVGERRLKVRDAKDAALAVLVPLPDDSTYVSAMDLGMQPTGTRTRVILPDGWRNGTDAAIVRDYDCLGRLLRESTPDAGETRYVHDRGGRARFAQTAADAAEGRITWTTYDAMSRMTARGHVTAEWNEPLLLERAELPGWPLTDPGAGAVTTGVWRYDGDGWDALALGQLVGSRSQDTGAPATVDSSYRWTPLGQPEARTLRVTWDDGEEAAPLEVTFGYDNTNALVRLGLPRELFPQPGPLRYGRDVQGNITSIQDEAGAELASFGWDAMARVRAGRSGPVSWEMAYDSPGHLLRSTASAGTVATQAYTFAPDSNVRGTSAVLGAQREQLAYGYDGLGRITTSQSVEGTDAAERFQYEEDLNGNIHELSGAKLSYVPGGNRLDTVAWPDGSETAFTWRADGTVSSRRTRGTGPVDLDFTYAPGMALPRSIQVRPGASDASTVEYAYDADGVRVATRVRGPGGEEREVRFPGENQPLFVTGGKSGTVLYVPGPTGCPLVYRDGVRYHASSDRLRSTRALFDAQGTLVEGFGYTAFGAARESTGAAPWMRLRFSGAEYDAETGLYNLNARLMDPVLGRFYAPDPADEFPSPYTYAGNHPTTRVDRTGAISDSGRVVVVVFSGAVAAAGTVAGLVLDVTTMGRTAGLSALASMVSAAGWNGMTYALTADDFSWGEFTGTVIVGGVSGFIRGGISGGIQGRARAGREEKVRGFPQQAARLAEDAARPDASRATKAKKWRSEATYWDQLQKKLNPAEDAWQQFMVALPHSALGNTIGYTVAGLVSIPLTNLVTLVVSGENEFGTDWKDALNVILDGAWGLTVGVGGTSFGYVKNRYKLKERVTRKLESAGNSILEGLTGPSVMGSSSGMSMGPSGQLVGIFGMN
ncbi:RHS repeat-associated core domain-containing protein [Corallococcus sp. CA049B]|uniref:RHS repeat-associated core domain-containing protein n=1 Tax=Corallococcus sp. CA049B TaxID=2316730 RepID=UPI000EA2F4F1|nr:RHS repeat-associated core domain-containing protein [Corallococcus sp. CA049B]RKG82366.1 RHS repeat-associated core domain-containing protein [Corallococcus sp. CA049B]